MTLILLHPEVAYRDCGDCLKYRHDEDTGAMRRNLETEKPMARRANEAVRCQTPKGCPMGNPEKRRALNPRNELTYYHYMECKAVGDFPDDGIVRRNAGTILAAEELANRIIACRTSNLLAAQSRASTATAKSVSRPHA